MAKVGGGSVWHPKRTVDMNKLILGLRLFVMAYFVFTMVMSLVLMGRISTLTSVTPEERVKLLKSESLKLTLGSDGFIQAAAIYLPALLILSVGVTVALTVLDKLKGSGSAWLFSMVSICFTFLLMASCLEVTDDRGQAEQLTLRLLSASSAGEGKLTNIQGTFEYELKLSSDAEGERTATLTIPEVIRKGQLQLAELLQELEPKDTEKIIPLEEKQ